MTSKREKRLQLDYDVLKSLFLSLFAALLALSVAIFQVDVFARKVILALAAFVFVVFSFIAYRLVTVTVALEKLYGN